MMEDWRFVREVQAKLEALEQDLPEELSKEIPAFISCNLLKNCQVVRQIMPVILLGKLNYNLQ
jgi:hypothetical protein